PLLIITSGYHPEVYLKMHMEVILQIACRWLQPNRPSVAEVVNCPLSDLTRKGQPAQVKWTNTTFQQLEEALTSAPVLWNPDFNLRFKVKQMLQAHDLALSFSRFSKGRRTWSFKLGLAERRYPAIEQEVPAIKWAIKEL
ncbi:hypothetical protein QTP70_020056, partial [Hemibagrus guttatus]